MDKQAQIAELQKLLENAQEDLDNAIDDENGDENTCREEVELLQAAILELKGDR